MVVGEPTILYIVHPNTHNCTLSTVTSQHVYSNHSVTIGNHSLNNPPLPPSIQPFLNTTYSIHSLHLQQLLNNQQLTTT